MLRAKPIPLWRCRPENAVSHAFIVQIFVGCLPLQVGTFANTIDYGILFGKFGHPLLILSQIYNCL